MPTVTSIKPQRNQKRVNVYLDDKFGFGIDIENFVKLGLKVEQELKEEEIEKIVKKAEFQKTLDKLLRFATLRPRSEKEIKDWFKKRKVHESLYKELLNRLSKLELIDDKKFAKWWVDQRNTFKPRGKRVLEMELRLKGIKKEIAQEILGDLKVNEEKVAKDLLQKKVYRWKSLPVLERKLKMSQFLARKGFGWDVIEKSVDKMLKLHLE
ncbi:MAG: Regulatory protein RecX [Candidatus Woesebacteria bacterium GW2011_GWA1_45_8]|uniref:Regulatory protein RecX n=1 Tax=Candidatus Woesebacteria bacterium GW2011_GWA1_45_8 TaxID=1618559 RepID=A0A0G1Q3S0_9BACT|nr:MAG: Regulatory protein RecX [Candidatus Woesebacteria bacterium GW2011_GWA1_45_8]